MSCVVVMAASRKHLCHIAVHDSRLCLMYTSESHANIEETKHLVKLVFWSITIDGW